VTDFRPPALGELGWGDELLDSLHNLHERLTALEASGYALTSHTHTQAQSHNTADTDSGAGSLHHTIGVTATKAAAGNHLHALATLSDFNPAGSDGQMVTKSGAGYILSTPGGVGGVTDHGALTGLADDDHSQYLNNTRGDARYYVKETVDSSLATKADTSHTHSADDIVDQTLDIARLPAGSTVVNAWTGSAYPNRPTSRSDIIVIWRGPQAPAIGGVGALAGVDLNLLTP